MKLVNLYLQEQHSCSVIYIFLHESYFEIVFARKNTGGIL